MSNNLHGIILKKIDLKNDDKSVTIFTKEEGKISVIAKGIKKITSRKRASVEIFNIIKLSYKGYKSIYYLHDTLIIKSFNIAKKTPEEIINSMYILEISDKIMPLDEPNETIFKLLAKTIYFLSEKYSDNITNAFNLKLLKILGFYDSNQSIYLNKNLKDYLRNLEKMTYEEIWKIPEDKNTENLAKNYIVGLTEEVLESKIKTLQAYQRLTRPL